MKSLSFWAKKAVIWRLFNDDLRVREREQEEKGTTNSAPLCDLTLGADRIQIFDLGNVKKIGLEFTWVQINKNKDQF